ncbi:EAL domain-containing protein [Vibrio sp. WJH972]
MRGQSANLNTLTNNYHSLQNRVGIILPVLAIFIITFFAGSLYTYYSTFSTAHTLGRQAISNLEVFINRTAHDLDRVSISASETCNKNDISKLRNYVFATDRIKEVGMYDANGSIYCTSNAGQANIAIYRSVLDRLEHSTDRTTIELTDSPDGIPTFFIFSSTPKKSGINALIPPRHFLELISSSFDDMSFGYQIQVLTHVIDGQQIVPSKSNRVLTFRSNIYPLSIRLNIGLEAYITYFTNLAWVIILCASLLTVGYLIVRDYRRSNHTLDASLRSAIQNNQLKLYFQPIVDSRTRSVVGSEALLRWNDPNKGYISPAIFIPLAEQIGIIKELTYRVIDYLTNYIERHKLEFEDRYISMNISRTLVLDDEFISYIYDYAITHPIMAKVVMLEITEDNNFSPEEMVKAVHNLTLLKNLGFRMAIDDFGTGYSGLNFIHQHPFDKLKIDQVFIRSLSQNEALDAVVLSMIDLSNQLGMEIIAEGVEDSKQVEALANMGVTQIQGFYYAKPMPAEEFIGYIKASEKNVL